MSQSDSFGEIVKIHSRKLITTTGTCYIHLKCHRGFNITWCLDWREICNGKIDCWPDAIDELHCDQLEKSECDLNEFRCRNGQCIPREFLLDNQFIPDCLDCTDEERDSSNIYPELCHSGDPSSRCQDITRRHSFDRSILRQCTLSGSCRSHQIDQFYRQLFSRTANNHVNDQCWSTMICMLKIAIPWFINDPAHAHFFNGTCNNICWEDRGISCSSKILQHCPQMFKFPLQPIVCGHIYFVYSSNQTQRTELSSIAPTYVCYSEELCGRLFATIRFGGISNDSEVSCQNFRIFKILGYTSWDVLIALIQPRFWGCATAINKKEDCYESTQFLCGNKCISKHRLADRVRDCTDNSDETFDSSCTISNNNYRLQCTIENTKITQCIEPTFLKEYTAEGPIVDFTCSEKKKLPYFPTSCDGFVEYEETMTNGMIETDETDCDDWLCDNQYTRCDGTWNCLNGLDEANCQNTPCRSGEHPCLLPNTTKLICLPVNRSGDGIVDCLGATDERHLCRKLDAHYRCWNQTENIVPSFKNMTNISSKECIDIDSICDGKFDCLNGDDELDLLCKKGYKPDYCTTFLIPIYPFNYLNEMNLLCNMHEYLKRILRLYKTLVPHLSLANRSIHAPLSVIQSAITQSTLRSYTNKQLPQIVTDRQVLSNSNDHCHGGIPIYLSYNESNTLSNNEVKKKCLCPPSFYGAQCQYQNERISITLQIGAPDWRTPFSFVIYLLDNQMEQTIHSYQRISYLSIRDCDIKFTFNLLYQSRPKMINKTYAVRIDVYETMNLSYRASWKFEILYPFLPVYRLAIKLTVPAKSSASIECPLKCGDHGYCTVYMNTKSSFCRCDPKWWGSFCTNQYRCNCSLDSLCAGSTLSTNRSICICPLEKFGSRCYLSNTFCQVKNAKKCLNEGFCVPRDPRIVLDHDTICSCPEQYRGNLCQYNNTRIDISFIFARRIPESFLLHFISIPEEWGPHKRATTFIKIPLDVQSISTYWSTPFNIVFVQFDDNIYLLFIQTIYKDSIHHKTSIDARQRCPSIRELLNSTIVAYPIIRRMKFYHKPCQERVELECFHDEDQFMCLCTHDRRANCFGFDHHMRYNCQGINYCENGGLCFQNSATCPTASMCACPTCFFGFRCQFSSQGFGLSLDAILGYQIQPQISFNNQRVIVKMGMGITIGIFVIGLTNGILSVVTFVKKQSRKNGCGSYLLTSSIISLLTMSIFTLKYILLVVSQMNMITDRIYLMVQCFTVDFLLKILLQIGDWLYACVAIERFFIVVRGINFNNKLSKKAAKWIILMLIIFTIGTSMHEPMYRQLIDDEEENRVWCIIRYPSSLSPILTSYTSTMSIVHFISPFSLNMISLFSLIIILARRRSKSHQQHSYYTHLCFQFSQHKHQIISSIMIISLSLPRLIFAFVLKCMKSPRDSVLLFLFGYFLSFIPPSLTFIVFVLPSKTYIKQFKTSFHSLRKKIC